MKSPLSSRVGAKLTLLRKPKKAPTNVKGTEIPNHSAKRATRIPKEMAPELPLLHRTKLRMKNTPKTILEIKNIMRGQL